MELVTKPDLEEVKQRWNAFWEGEVLDRPLVCAMAPTVTGVPLVNISKTRYWNPCSGHYEAQLDLLDRWAESTLFMGDLIPFVSPDHGPDQFAAWMGSRLNFTADNIETNWTDPILESWDDFLPASLHRDNEVWQSVLKYARLLHERGQGKYLVGMADLHSHLDAFSALRHPDKLCLDLYDEPEQVQKGCAQMRAMYPEIYEAIYKAGGMSRETGTICGQSLWCKDRIAVVQCDFSVFLSNEMWREFALPGIREEIEYLDHCFYHLDGKQQLTHLDDLLEIPKLDGIQWLPGEGQPEPFDPSWRDMLKKVLRAGKKVLLQGPMDLATVQSVHRDLGPQGIVYVIWDRTREELEEIINWLGKNT